MSTFATANAEIAQLVEHNLAQKIGKGKQPWQGDDAKATLLSRKTQCGNSSVGRAQPCQGWGREFEPRFPL